MIGQLFPVVFCIGHTVVSGDTCWKIGQTCGVTYQDIKCYKEGEPVCSGTPAGSCDDPGFVLGLGMVIRMCFAKDQIPDGQSLKTVRDGVKDFDFGRRCILFWGFTNFDPNPFSKTLLSIPKRSIPPTPFETNPNST